MLREKEEEEDEDRFYLNYSCLDSLIRSKFLLFIFFQSAKWLSNGHAGGNNNVNGERTHVRFQSEAGISHILTGLTGENEAFSICGHSPLIFTPIFTSFQCYYRHIYTIPASSNYMLHIILIRCWKFPCIDWKSWRKCGFFHSKARHRIIYFLSC